MPPRSCTASAPRPTAATAATTSRDGNPVFAFGYAGTPVVDAHGATLPPAIDGVPCPDPGSP